MQFYRRALTAQGQNEEDSRYRAKALVNLGVMAFEAGQLAAVSKLSGTAAYGGGEGGCCDRVCGAVRCQAMSNFEEALLYDSQHEIAARNLVVLRQAQARVPPSAPSVALGAA